MFTSQMIFWTIIVGLHAAGILITLRALHTAKQSTLNLREFLMQRTDVIFEVQNAQQAEKLAYDFQIPEVDVSPGTAGIYDFKDSEDDSLEDLRIGIYTPHLTNKSKYLMIATNLIPVFGPLALLFIYITSLDIFNRPETYNGESIERTDQ